MNADYILSHSRQKPDVVVRVCGCGYFILKSPDIEIVVSCQCFFLNGQNSDRAQDSSFKAFAWKVFVTEDFLHGFSSVQVISEVLFQRDFFPSAESKILSESSEFLLCFGSEATKRDDLSDALK